MRPSYIIWSYSWEFIFEEQDTQTAFDLFYECCYDFLNAFYPEKYVKIKSADPSYMTPQIKFLLLEKNKLMRKGEMSAAANVACRIGKLISAHNSISFKSGSMHLHRVSTIKDLWSRVRQITKKGSAEPNTTVVSAEQLNAHYANTSSDPNYETPLHKSTVSDNKIIFDEITTFNHLDKLKPTSEGLDKIPHWFLRLTAASIASPVAYLFNLTLLNSVVPTQWKTSLISPRPKIPQPETCADYRPISITPILSRLLEKQVARMFLYPILSLPNVFSFFQDQFAFRPTGSTTASLIYLIHSISSLLQYTTSTCTLFHLISLKLLTQFDITLCSRKCQNTLFLTSCTTGLFHFLPTDHTARSSGGSSLRYMTSTQVLSKARDWVPSRLCIMHLICTRLTLQIKYANTRTISTWSCHPHTLTLYLLNLKTLKNGARINNLKLNKSKSHEMIVRKPRTDSSINPPTTNGIERVREMVVLGVKLTDTLSFHQHVDRIVARTAQTSYALRLLRSHGLGAPQIYDCARATLVAQLTYASPAWAGFTNCEDNARLQSVLNKVQRAGFLPPNFQKFKQIVDAADVQLFRSIISNEDHILHQLLPCCQNQFT